MNLYLISQDYNRGHDTYDSAIVVAENENTATKILPCSISSASYTRTDSVNVTAKYIGIADDSLEEGCILASFNAG